jgi:hypothetical protein
MGHLVLKTGDHDFDEAWADHMAAFVALPYLYGHLGKNAWPDPYDYLMIEGPERSIKFAKEAKGSFDFAVKILCELDQKYGIEIFRNIIKTFRHEFLATGPIALARIKHHLFELIKDDHVVSLFEEYKIIGRGKLFANMTRDSLHPSETDSIRKTPGLAVITGKSIVFCGLSKAECDSLFKDEELGVKNVMLEFLKSWNRVTDFFRQTDVKVEPDTCRIIPVAMANAKYLMYDRTKFKHLVGVIMTDGKQEPRVFSGVGEAEDIIAEAKRFYKVW